MTGTVEGVALAPGVSLNKRLYTKGAIEKAHARLAARLADPNGSPVVMRTHHAAGDDSTRIVAQLTKVGLTPEGALTYQAKFANTEHAQTIRQLAKPSEGGKPHLAHVSIYGWWVGDPTTTEMDDGTSVETADDLEIDAIDFTASPGVIAATARAEAHRGNALTESHDAEITVTETSEAVLSSPATFADPGYRPDHVKRLPLGTVENVLASWATFQNLKKGSYTPTQESRIRKHIKAEARKLDIAVQDDWLIAPGTETTSGGVLGEMYDAYGGDSMPASFCYDATNGPINVRISSWCIDPADLEIVTAAAVQAANDALKALDPDMDADIDLPGTGEDDPSEPNGGDQMETTHTDPPADPAGETEAAAAAAETTEEVAPMSETTTTEAAATVSAPAAVLPEIDYGKLAEALAPAMVAASEKAATDKAAADAAAKAAQESAANTATAAQAQLREVTKDAVRELLAEGGLASPTRKGAGLAEQTETDGLASAELWENRSRIFIAAARENQQLGRTGTEALYQAPTQ